MKLKITYLIIAVVLSFTTAMRVVGQIPLVSTEGNDKWYYIYSAPRNLPEAKWLTGAGDAGELSIAEFTGTDTQRWKVVKHGEGFALMNKAFGTYMNTDITYSGAVATTEILSATSSLPLTPVKLVSTTSIVDGVFILDLNTVVSPTGVVDNATITFCYYSVGSGINKPISYNQATSVAAVRFLTDKDLLRDAIATVHNALNNLSVGGSPGQYPQEAVDGISEALEGFKAIYEGPALADEVYLESANQLLHIHNLFQEMINLPEKNTWYYFHAIRPNNTYMTYVQNAAIRTLNLIPNDTQLWRFVDNPNGGLALQNKASSAYVNADIASDAALPVIADFPVNGLRIIATNQFTNKIVRYAIVNEVGSLPAFRLHHGNSNVRNYTPIDTNSAWLLLSHNDMLRTTFLVALTKARDIYNPSLEGTIIGQYPKQLRDDLLAAIEAAESVDLEDFEEQEILDAIAELELSIKNFVSNTDVSTLESPTPHQTDRWFRIVNAATHQYARFKAMSSRGRVVDQKLTFENIDLNTDEQLFRFELNKEKTAVRAIVNKANSMYMAGNGSIVAALPNVLFTVTPLDGFSFWIKPDGLSPIHAAEIGTHIVNWNSGAGSASAWRLDFVKDESNIVHLEKERTITVSSSQPSKGTAVISGTTSASVKTNVKRISVTANRNKSAFFVNWTNTAGDTLSNYNPYVYEGEEDIEIIANFEDAYYRPMTRSFGASNPTNQSADRYLESVWVNIGDAKQIVFEGISTNPLPVDPAVLPNQDIKETIVDYTEEPIIVPLGADSFQVVFKAKVRPETVENLRWTRQIVFIDWDKDFSFLGENERTERNDSSLIAPSGYARTLPVPEGIFEDYYRMRVVYHETTEANWETTIWLNNKVRGGIVYDFTIKYGNPTSVESVTRKPLSVRVVNSIVTIEGDENFELYNIAGQRLNNKQALKSGVYIVKSKSTIEKVFVK